MLKNNCLTLAKHNINSDVHSEKASVMKLMIIIITIIILITIIQLIILI